MAGGKMVLAVKRRNRTKNIRQYRKGTARVFNNLRLPTILPDRYTCKLRYGDFYELNATAVANGIQVFKANSLYDPDATGVGHQPRGFDQMVQFYNHFVVTKSTIKVVNIPNGTANTNPGVWGVMLTSNGTTTAAYTPMDMIESEHMTTYKVAGIQNNHISSRYGNEIKKRFDLKRFFNKKSTDGDEFQCTSAADPLEMAYFELVEISPNTSLDPGEHLFWIEIVYTVTCHEPKQVASS